MNPDKLMRLLVRCGVERPVNRGTDITALCPYHDESSPSWGIQTQEPYLFGCFACNARGSIVTLLIDKLKIGRTKAEQLAEVNASTKRIDDLSLEADSVETDYVMQTAFDTFVPAQEAYRYMLRRGVSLQTSKKAAIRYDFSQNRVLFPWRLDGHLVGITGRAIDPDEEVKTLPYASTKKGRYLYVPSPDFSPKDSRLVLVEGEIDALRVMQDVTVNVAAVGFGKFTPEQQELVVSWSPREVVAFFDDDDTGRALTAIVRRTIGKTLRVSSVDYRSVHANYDEEAKLDPASLTKKDRKKLLAETRNDLSLTARRKPLPFSGYSAGIPSV